MAKARTELIHCDNCGEDYAATYRRCPFCNNKAQRQDEYDGYDEYDDTAHRGGKRLAGGPGLGDPARIALYALAALVVIVVICVLISVIIPKLVAPAPSAAPTPSQSAAPSENAVTATAQPSQDPAAIDDPDASFHPLPVLDGMGGEDDPLALDSPYLPTVEPDPVSSAAVSAAPAASQPPAGAAPSAPVSSGSLKLSSTDFTLSPRYPTYQLETGLGRALVTYSVKNEAVATVSSSGLVTAVGDGNTTITVTDQNGNTASAIVRVSGISGQSSATQAPASQAPASQTSSGGAKLNHTDFSITATYPDPIRLRVQGGEAAGWKSANTNVATVSDNGTVTGVGNGSTKITCTLTDGSTLTCDVHVSGL